MSSNNLLINTQKYFCCFLIFYVGVCFLFVYVFVFCFFNSAIIGVFKTEPRIQTTKHFEKSHWIITFDIRLKILPGSYNLTGNNFWKLNLWGTTDTLNSNMDKFGFTEQALSKAQASLSLVANETADIIRFKFKDVMFRLDVADDECFKIKLICARIGQLDSKAGYKLIGVRRNGKSKPSNLSGCTALDICV